ncbi:MAG: hypothetical protein JWO89_1337 [Verrucomicrobiaceae bacterium]|nr:hypothetical protein [Verrucomicrobiaceae bacterium]
MKRFPKIMLVMVPLIGFLVALFDPLRRTGTATRASKVRTQATLKDMVLGLQSYHVDYGRWPVSGSNEVKMPCAGALLQILLGDNVDGLNVRGIAYIEPPMSRKGFGGLIGTVGAFQLTDAWGHPYVILLDTNGDGKLANPDVKNTGAGISASAPAQIVAEVAAFTLGPDGIEGTKDDVVSWRP